MTHDLKDRFITAGLLALYVLLIPVGVALLACIMLAVCSPLIVITWLIVRAL
jgi:hypothetical protein